MARTFVIQETTVTVVERVIDEEQARFLFPFVRWDEEDVSHAGDMEDESQGPAGLPAMGAVPIANKSDETTVRIWER